ncbi:MAG: hypothetical protein PWQ91_856 [Eubacteriales bacterium]|nr:hypothetical protein [Eubacteriales bacterium]MDN5363795.1 hypothetical protein [Eubacteriales bacterium]
MEICFHYRDVEGQQKMLATLTRLMSRSGEQVILCIGTDRSAGDCLGPLVGTLLQEEYPKAVVYGTLAKPVHALNLEETWRKIRTLHPAALVVAVDASLGRQDMVEHIIMQEGPLKPGAGVEKNLPAVGDVTIKGVVNVNGFMPHFLLQNTRLHVTYSLARVIAGVLAQALIGARCLIPVVGGSV